MMNDLETKSGKLLLEKCIQNLDDITNLITFIEEKMESWSRLKVILIGEEIYIVLYLFVHFQILGDIEEGFHDNGDLPKFEPSPEADQIPEVKMETRSDPEDTESDEDTGDDDFIPEKWHRRKMKKVKNENSKEEEEGNSEMDIKATESKELDEQPKTLKIKAKGNPRGTKGNYRGSRKGCPNKVKKKDKIDMNGTYVCDECGGSFDGYLVFRKHVKTQHASKKEREYQCPLCGDVMTCMYSKFQVHKIKCEASMAVEANFICSICGKAYLTQKKLNLHMYTCQAKFNGQYKPPKPTAKLECTYEGCDYKIDGRVNLENHIRKVHLNLPLTRDYVCNICGATYNKKGHLKMHISSIHENLRPHKCEHCGKDFSRRQRLKEHIEGIHQGLLKHKCNYCDKAYNNNGSKWNHMKSCTYNPNKL